MKLLIFTANAAFIAMIAAKHGVMSARFEDWAESQINYMLGSNSLGLSYVVGFGDNYPMRYHHRAA